MESTTGYQFLLPVWDLLLHLASLYGLVTPDRRDQRHIVSHPKDTCNVGVNNSPEFRSGTTEIDPSTTLHKSVRANILLILNRSLLQLQVSCA